jgi:hypothetical protein
MASIRPVGASYSVTSWDLRVPMDQPTKAISSHDPPGRRQENGHAGLERRFLLQGAVRAVAVVVVDILGPYRTQLPTAQDQHPNRAAIGANWQLTGHVRLCAPFRFLTRAVSYLAGKAQVRQFLDIGTGLPTADNTHEVAQRVAPDARVVYVDNDPLVLTHARALLSSTPQGVTAYIDADLRDPDKILAAAAQTGLHPADRAHADGNPGPRRRRR